MFSQCQPIYARSMLPCQDTPSVKFTYNAKLHCPASVTGLMSAIATQRSEGYAEFEQTVPIESYLIAIAVGDVVSKDLSPMWVFYCFNPKRFLKRYSLLFSVPVPPSGLSGTLSRRLLGSLQTRPSIWRRPSRSAGSTCGSATICW